jgi:hypothetical protein
MLALVLLFVTSVSTLSEHEMCGGYKCPGGDWECTPDSVDLAIAGPWEQCGSKE